MDVSTFYALFAATCFTLVGLWWNVVRGRDDRMRRPALRRGVGGVCLSFLLPALMGLFAQVGGDSTPGLRRAGFTMLAVIGCVHTAGSRVRAQGRLVAVPGCDHGAAALLHLLIAVVGAVPEVARVIGLAPIQAEAVPLILLVVLGHGLVWRFTAGEGCPAGDE
ncbi:hypothetical protein [Streptomyces wuyuanensis]|uniref:hypothetical protein n=1 Tax=Streptomyces wuyuanensis TaxID=1196353 RepID=UPI003698719F